MMPKVDHQTMTHAEWVAEGTRRFGGDWMAWRFVCPACGHVASTLDWKKAGAPIGAVGISCIGRWLGSQRQAFGGEGPGPCDYAGFGLFRIAPITVRHDNGDEVPAFAFAEEIPDAD